MLQFHRRISLHLFISTCKGEETWNVHTSEKKGVEDCMMNYLTQILLEKVQLNIQKNTYIFTRNSEPNIQEYANKLAF